MLLRLNIFDNIIATQNGKIYWYSDFIIGNNTTYFNIIPSTIRCIFKKSLYIYVISSRGAWNFQNFGFMQYNKHF